MDHPDLPAGAASAPDDADAALMPAIGLLVGHDLARVERALILRTLAQCRGNRTTAAHVLGISVRTMRNKLRLCVEDGIAITPAAPPGAPLQKAR